MLSNLSDVKPFLREIGYDPKGVVVSWRIFYGILKFKHEVHYFRDHIAMVKGTLTMDLPGTQKTFEDFK
jgi:hypothetical protein